MTRPLFSPFATVLAVAAASSLLVALTVPLLTQLDDRDGSPPAPASPAAEPAAGPSLGHPTASVRVMPETLAMTQTFTARMP